MIKLIIFILVFALFLGFIVLNLEHRSDISFGFYSFQDIPVFLSILSSFALGMLISIPLALSFGRKKKKKQLENQNVHDLKQIKAETLEDDKIKKEVSPYGID